MTELEPGNPEYRLNYAKASLMVKHPYNAIVECNNIIDLQPTDKNLLIETRLTLSTGYTEAYWENHRYLSEQEWRSIKAILKQYWELLGSSQIEDAIQQLVLILEDEDISPRKKERARKNLTILNKLLKNIKKIEASRRGAYPGG